MSQAGSTGSGGSGGSGITTINGDTGSITGATVTIFANRATQNSGSTVSFTNTGTVSTFNVSQSNNTIIGSIAGNATVSGNFNTSLGIATLHFLTSGSSNTASGYHSLLAVTSGSNDTASGRESLSSCTTGSRNSAFGNSSLNSTTTSNDNSAFGFESGKNTNGFRNTVFGTSAYRQNGGSSASANDNIIIGYLAGDNYTSEDTNICIGNIGQVADIAFTRLGTQGTHLAAFVAGITGVTVVASSPVAVDANGQLSDLGFGTSGQVLTSNGAGASPSWQTSTTFSGVNWIVNNVSGLAAVNVGNIITSGVVAFTLPAGVINQQYGFLLRGGTSWTINLSGQTINWGILSGTTSFASNSSGDMAILLCTSANTYEVIAATGGPNLT